MLLGQDYTLLGMLYAVIYLHAARKCMNMMMVVAVIVMMVVVMIIMIMIAENVISSC